MAEKVEKNHFITNIDIYGNKEKNDL